MLDFRDSAQEKESCDSDMDVSKEMLLFSSTRCELNFRNSGQDTESYDVDGDLNK